MKNSSSASVRKKQEKDKRRESTDTPISSMVCVCALACIFVRKHT